MQGKHPSQRNSSTKEDDTLAPQDLLCSSRMMLSTSLDVIVQGAPSPFALVSSPSRDTLQCE